MNTTQDSRSASVPAGGDPRDRVRHALVRARDLARHLDPGGVAGQEPASARDLVVTADGTPLIESIPLDNLSLVDLPRPERPRTRRRSDRKDQLPACTCTASASPARVLPLAAGLAAADQGLHERARAGRPLVLRARRQAAGVRLLRRLRARQQPPDRLHRALRLSRQTRAARRPDSRATAN